MAIRIVHYPAWVYSHMCHHLSPRTCHPSSGCRTWMNTKALPHITFSNPGVDYLSLPPLESPVGSTKRTQTMQGTETPPLADGFAASLVHSHIYMMQPSSSFFFYAYAKWKARTNVTPGRRHGSRY